ncbi:MAG TPA: hypothetical protein VK956_11365, partial [Verrucomicrobium sp.]|nr:hypothetical protein [Verrucomicrobium sp.]
MLLTEPTEVGTPTPLAMVRGVLERLPAGGIFIDLLGREVFFSVGVPTLVGSVCLKVCVLSRLKTVLRTASS